MVWLVGLIGLIGWFDWLVVWFDWLVVWFPCFEFDIEQMIWLDGSCIHTPMELYCISMEYLFYCPLLESVCIHNQPASFVQQHWYLAVCSMNVLYTYWYCTSHLLCLVAILTRQWTLPLNVKAQFTCTPDVSISCGARCNVNWPFVLRASQSCSIVYIIPVHLKSSTVQLVYKPLACWPESGTAQYGLPEMRQCQDISSLSQDGQIV